MLQLVFTKGPFTQGIFRKSANVKLVRELREKLDRGDNVPLDHVPVPVVASLLKEFLRSLPDPLLCAGLYPRWRAALDAPNVHQRLLRLKTYEFDFMNFHIFIFSNKLFFNFLIHFFFLFLQCSGRIAKSEPNFIVSRSVRITSRRSQVLHQPYVTH